MPPRAALQIVLLADGTVNVTGPITDKVTCYGMLEFAKDLIRDYRAPAVEIPAGPDVRRLLEANGHGHG